MKIKEKSKLTNITQFKNQRLTQRFLLVHGGGRNLRRWLKATSTITEEERKKKKEIRKFIQKWSHFNIEQRLVLTHLWTSTNDSMNMKQPVFGLDNYKLCWKPVQKDLYGLSLAPHRSRAGLVSGEVYEAIGFHLE